MFRVWRAHPTGKQMAFSGLRGVPDLKAVTRGVITAAAFPREAYFEPDRRSSPDAELPDCAHNTDKLVVVSDRVRAALPASRASSSCRWR